MSCDTMEKVRIITKILILFGLWPITAGQWYKRYYPQIIHITLTLTCNISLWLTVILSNDINEAIEALYIALTETALVVKIINNWRYAAVAVKMLSVWEHSETYALKNLRESLLWKETQRSFGIVCVLYIMSAVSAIFIGYPTAIFTNTLPFAYWFPFDWKRSSNYWYAYFYQLITIAFTCISNSMLDVFHCYLLMHISFRFKIIGMRLQCLGRGQGVDDHVVTEELIDIIKLHQAVNRDVKGCERIINIPILIQIGLSTLVLCFSAYYLQSISISQNTASFFTLSQYSTAMILQIYLPCYYANRLTTDSNYLSFSIYDAEWIHMSVKNRRLILHYTQYLKKPVVINAGRIFGIGLPMFLKTINNAYALLAVLANVDLDENK